MMIDKVRTKQAFNIDVTKLRPSSVKKVWFTCDICGEPKLKPYRDCLSGTGVCISCHRKQQRVTV